MRHVRGLRDATSVDFVNSAGDLGVTMRREVADHGWEVLMRRASAAMPSSWRLGRPMVAGMADEGPAPTVRFDQAGAAYHAPTCLWSGPGC